MKYPSYPEYKEFGIQWLAEIPEHWEIASLRHVTLSIKDGTHGTFERVGEGVPLLSAKNIHDGSIHISETESLISYEDFVAITSNGNLQNGDVLLTIVGTIGRSAIFLLDEPVAFQRSVAMIRPTDKLLAKYLYHATQASYFQCELYSRAKQSAQSGVYLGDVASIPIPLPPSNAQQSIANFLDTKTSLIGDLIAKKEKQIELLKEKRTAIINQAVTKGLNLNVPMKDSGIEWLGEVPEHWMISKLKFAASKIVDCPHETPTYSPDGEYLAIRTADVSEGILDLSNAYRLDREEFLKRIRRLPVEPNDIVYGREGERWGFAALVPEKENICLGQRMMQFRAGDHFDTSFLMWQLNSNFVYRQGQIDTVGATSPHVNVETIRNYILTEPPLTEQIEIASRLNTIASQINQTVIMLKSQIEKLREYRQSVISAAVTGKIDVREAVKRERDAECN